MKIWKGNNNIHTLSHWHHTYTHRSLFRYSFYLCTVVPLSSSQSMEISHGFSRGYHNCCIWHLAPANCFHQHSRCFQQADAVKLRLLSSHRVTKRLVWIVVHPTKSQTISSDMPSVQFYDVTQRPARWMKRLLDLHSNRSSIRSVFLSWKHPAGCGFLKSCHIPWWNMKEISPHNIIPILHNLFMSIVCHNIWDPWWQVPILYLDFRYICVLCF